MYICTFLTIRFRSHRSTLTSPWSFFFFCIICFRIAQNALFWNGIIFLYSNIFCFLSTCSSYIRLLKTYPKKMLYLLSFENPAPCVYRFITTKAFLGLNKKIKKQETQKRSFCSTPFCLVASLPLYFLSQLLSRSPSLPLFLTSCELRRGELLWWM